MNDKSNNGDRPVVGYEAEALAIRAKTERLRALRLAREAAEGPAVRKASPGSRSRTAKGKGGAKAAKSAGTLADWLENQRKDGLA